MAREFSQTFVCSDCKEEITYRAVFSDHQKFAGTDHTCRGWWEYKNTKITGAPKTVYNNMNRSHVPDGFKEVMSKVKESHPLHSIDGDFQ